MGSGQGAHLAPDGAYVGGFTAVEADSLVEHATAHGIALHVVIVSVDQAILLLQLLGSHVGMCSSVLLLVVLADGFESLGACMLLQSLLRHVVSLLVASNLHCLAKLLIVHLVAVLALHVLAQLL